MTKSLVIAREIDQVEGWTKQPFSIVPPSTPHWAYMYDTKPEDRFIKYKEILANPDLLDNYDYVFLQLINDGNLFNTMDTFLEEVKKRDTKLILNIDYNAPLLNKMFYRFDALGPYLKKLNQPQNGIYLYSVDISQQQLYSFWINEKIPIMFNPFSLSDVDQYLKRQDQVKDAFLDAPRYRDILDKIHHLPPSLVSITWHKWDDNMVLPHTLVSRLRDEGTLDEKNLYPFWIGYGKHPDSVSGIPDAKYYAKHMKDSWMQYLPFSAIPSSSYSFMVYLLHKSNFAIDTYTTHSVGRTVVDCAAVGTPMICSDMSYTGHYLYPELMSHFTDLETQYQQIKKLTTDIDFYHRIKNEAREKVKVIDYQGRRDRLQEFLDTYPKTDEPCMEGLQIFRYG